MLRHECRQKVLAKLTTARCELEHALTLSTPIARYDPKIVPDAMRLQITEIITNINAVVQRLEGIQ